MLKAQIILSKFYKLLNCKNLWNEFQDTYFQAANKQGYIIRAAGKFMETIWHLTDVQKNLRETKVIKC